MIGVSIGIISMANGQIIAMTTMTINRQYFGTTVGRHVLAALWQSDIVATSGDDGSPWRFAEIARTAPEG